MLLSSTFSNISLLSTTEPGIISTTPYKTDQRMNQPWQAQSPWQAHLRLERPHPRQKVGTFLIRLQPFSREGEVNMHLEDYFQSVLPGCKFSRFKSREIDDGNTALEMDSFSHMTHDTLEPPQTNNALGIYVVQPNRINKRKPEGAPRKLANSPGAKAANLGRHAEKYVVGESYSGDREDKIRGKVNQLEEKLVRMKQRHSIQSPAVSDATSLFGAAILSFTCQTLPRKDQSKKCMKAVLEELSFTQTPILWRLAQAERFFIVVLSTREGANTCALREITRGIQGVEIGIQAILERLDEKAGEEGNEEIGVAEHQY